jgi:hypothetical protein
VAKLALFCFRFVRSQTLRRLAGPLTRIPFESVGPIKPFDDSHFALSTRLWSSREPRHAGSRDTTVATATISRPSADETMHNYRHVTPLAWGSAPTITGSSAGPVAADSGPRRARVSLRHTCGWPALGALRTDSFRPEDRHRLDARRSIRRECARDHGHQQENDGDGAERHDVVALGLIQQ